MKMENQQKKDYLNYIGKIDGTSDCGIRISDYIKKENLYLQIHGNIEDNNFKFIDTVISKDIKEAFKKYKESK